MKKLVSLAVALVLALSLVACGGNNSTEGNGGDEATGAPLKIVYCGTALTQESGDRAQQVLTIAAEAINAEGGVNGQPVEVEFIDGGTDQQAYIDAYLKAIEVDGVSAVIGTFFSQYALACADYANEAQVPTFNVATNFEMAEACDYYYTNRCVDTAFANVMAQIAIDAGCTNPVSMFYNTSNGYNDNEFQKNYLEEAGYSVAAEIPFDNVNTTDYTSIVLQAMNTEGADGIILHATANNDGPAIIELLHEYNYDKPIISNSNLFSDQFVSIVGAEAVQGIIGFAEYATTLDRPEIDAFEQMLADGGFTYDTTSWTDASFYDDFCLIVEAAKQAGANDKDSVNEGLRSISGLKGVMTDYSWHDDHSFADTIYLASFDENGKTVVSDELEDVHS